MVKGAHLTQGTAHLLTMSHAGVGGVRLPSFVEELQRGGDAVDSPFVKLFFQTTSK